MWWRLKRSDFIQQKGDGNRRALKEIVDSGEVPGILAYANGEPIGWCSVARRKAFPALKRSRILKPLDDEEVWSVVCFFVSKKFRGKGLALELLKNAAEYAKANGGKIVEGYPVEPKENRMPDAFAYTGLASTFRKAGFVEIVRRSETRPIMRYRVIGKQPRR